MYGTAVETVASSWIEGLGGMSMCWILRTPPRFCAQAALAVAVNDAAATSTAIHPIRIFILVPPFCEPRALARLGTTGDVAYALLLLRCWVHLARANAVRLPGPRRRL